MGQVRNEDEMKPHKKLQAIKLHNNYIWLAKNSIIRGIGNKLAHPAEYIVKTLKTR